LHAGEQHIADVCLQQAIFDKRGFDFAVHAPVQRHVRRRFIALSLPDRLIEDPQTLCQSLLGILLVLSMLSTKSPLSFCPFQTCSHHRLQNGSLLDPF
jgi:hypothetical protein